MITGRFWLDNFGDWQIRYFMLTDSDDADDILESLESLGCSRKFMRRAESLLCSDRLNIGISYTKPSKRISIIVVSKTTNVWEFFNSFAHEIDHIEKHISKALKFSPYSEPASYLVGEIIREMFYSIFKQVTC